MEREIQENIWDYDIEHKRDDQSNIARYVRMMNIIKKHVSKDKKLLEVGFWSGYLFEKLQGDIKCYGIDISSKIVDSCREKFKKEHINAELSRQSIEETTFEDDFFDVIVAIEVIEHLPDIAKGIKEINRILKINGVFIGSVPANENLSENIILCPYCRKTFHRFGHQNSFSKDNLKTLFENNGFSCDIKHVFFVETQLSFYRWTYTIVRKILDILDRKTKRFGGNYVFVATKARGI